MVAKTKPCPQCRKNGEDVNGDNLVTHPEHAYNKCFKCGYYEAHNAPLVGKYIEIFDRGLSKITCEKYGIQVVSYTGNFTVKGESIAVIDERCVAFNTYEKGQLIRQKLRSLDNKSYMKLIGTNTKSKALYGKHTCNPNKKIPITITEGEFDAAAVFQSTGLPAVSLPNGATGVDALLQELDWLQGWKYIVLMLDNDEAGAAAVEKALSILPVGKVRIAKLPYKDANEMVLEGRADDLKPAIWNAEIHRPESIVTVEDILSKVLDKPLQGYSLPWDFLNEGMYGLQPNHIYILAGAAQVGKTEFLREIIFHLIDQVKIPVGIFSLEQGAASTIQRMVGSMVNKRLHLPSNEWWDEEQIKEYAMTLNNKIFLYQNSSNESLSLESLLINIRYMHYCYGTNVIVIDNLTAMCNNPVIDDKYVGKYVYIGHIMNKLFTLSRELPLSIIVVSHLGNDKVSKQVHIPTSAVNKASYMMISESEMDSMINKPGLDWNSGRMPGLDSLDGSDIVAKLADYVIGLARDTVNKNDVIKRTLKVKLLKTRLASEFCGKEMKLLYNYESGRYE